MSFSTPFTCVVISPIADLTAELLNREPQEAESGWDSMRDTYLVRNDAAGITPTACFTAGTGISGFARADQVSGHNMWIVARTPKVIAYGLFRVEVLSMGLLSERGYKVTYDAAAAAQSNTSVTAPNPPPATDSSLYAKVQTREGSVTATFEYIATASVGPTHAEFLTALTGRHKDLPSGWEPTVPDSVWTELVTFTYNWPNGWIFDGAAMENLPGLSTVFLIKEKYAYQYERTPG